MLRAYHNCLRVVLLNCTYVAAAGPLLAQSPTGAAKTTAPANKAPDQAALESAFSKMLSGATLQGSYTLSGKGEDETKLNREKYTLGEVKKVAGDIWLFPARIEYGGKDVTLPIPLPVRWAGDTPMVVVDNVALPGFGTVSARVLFFDGHYAGYWKHGDASGNLFGVIEKTGETNSAVKPKSAPDGGAERNSRANPPAGEQP